MDHLPDCRSQVNGSIVIDMKSHAQGRLRRPGRPLSFDRETALRQAMLLFWQHGYEGTSLSDLTAAMGVTAPSIYTAFGDKRRLFLEAVDRYLSGRSTPILAIEQAATARDAAWSMLQAAAAAFTGADTPPGCLLASAAISCSRAASDVKTELATIRQAIEAALRRRIEADMAGGILDASTDPDALAGQVMAVVQGMSTLARDGASREKLLRIAGTTMRAWP
jgi:AcrR family transcriptional regulator